MNDRTSSHAHGSSLRTAVTAACLAALLAACAAGCESDNKKKTPIRGTATFEKATFQKGEKLD